MKPISYARHRFPPDVIRHAVWLYLRFTLSYRDVEDLLADRLTRSLADFAKLVELFDEHGVSFVSITQSFNTTSSMGRLTLNVLLSSMADGRDKALASGRRIDQAFMSSSDKVGSAVDKLIRNCC